MTREKIVLALGGNALLPNSKDKGEKKLTFEQQWKSATRAFEALLPLFQTSDSLVITHGNGPQVGSIMIRAQAAQEKTYPLPLEVAVAQTQGETGYLLAQTLENTLKRNGISRSVITVITRVEVRADDPGFAHPTKPIGPFYSEEEGEKLKEEGIKVIEDSGRGYRKVVPSPFPKKILEASQIQDLLDKERIVIAAGGGGIPVIVQSQGQYKGVPAVVDKDLASALLACQIGAGHLYILTAVDEVSLDFNTPESRPLHSLSASEARRYLAEDQFPPGSMGPKIQAALFFLEQGGKRVLIASAKSIQAALEGETAGTWIRP